MRLVASYTWAFPRLVSWNATALARQSELQFKQMLLHAYLETMMFRLEIGQAKPGTIQNASGPTTLIKAVPNLENQKIPSNIIISSRAPSLIPLFSTEQALVSQHPPWVLEPCRMLATFGEMMRF